MSSLNFLCFLFGLHTDTLHICTHICTHIQYDVCFFVCLCVVAVCGFKILFKKIPFGNLLYKNFIFLFEGEKGADPIIHDVFQSNRAGPWRRKATTIGWYYCQLFCEAKHARPVSPGWREDGSFDKSEQGNEVVRQASPAFFPVEAGS